MGTLSASRATDAFAFHHSSRCSFSRCSCTSRCSCSSQATLSFSSLPNTHKNKHLRSFLFGPLGFHSGRRDWPGLTAGWMDWYELFVRMFGALLRRCALRRAAARAALPGLPPALQALSACLIGLWYHTRLKDSSQHESPRQQPLATPLHRSTLQRRRYKTAY